jgi:phosphatidylinositol glycan class W
MDEILQDGGHGHVTDLKQLKEQFVSGLEGTTSWELLLVCSTSVVGVLFYYAILSLLIRASQPSRNISFYKFLILEVLSFWIPMILCQTIWLHPYGTYFMMGQTGVSFLAVSLKQFHRSSSHPNKMKNPGTNSDTIVIASLHRTTVTIYRACLLFLTTIAILAVDFHVFPRRFGKTEIRGFGLMDLGAASFVVAAGMVSPRAKQHSTSGKHIVWSKQVQRMIPLLLMGSLRLITHKGLDYPEHVSEYGVQWNFFFTLALLMPITSLLSWFHTRPSLIVPFIILSLYQYLLSMEGLQQWIEDGPRVCPSAIQEGFNMNTIRVLCNLWYANREGVLGCVSYAALYLTSEWWAFSLFWHAKSDLPESSTNTITTLWYRTGTLWISVAALFSLFQYLEHLGFFVSRRSTNAMFCVWVLFVNVLLLVAMYTVVVLLTLLEGFTALPLDPPPILASVNRNGLTSFIIANLLTGLVNLSINTLEIQNGIALSILMLYVCIVGILAVLMDSVLTKLLTFQQEIFGQESNAPNPKIGIMKKEN